ncbi:MAG TPA: T9SS type A sorting domain-containing protein, partial [Candidatus Cloacimonadota bacterium]|nr:T9SS type A sorting domain-containing protein [Candidatus Cloacimonadota bacterium]
HTINNPQYSSYVIVNEYDPQPNTVPANPNTVTRYLQALEYEENGQWDQALSLYYDILDEQLESERDCLNGCIDGIYRIRLSQSDQLEQLGQYIEAKIGQYAAVDSSFSGLLSVYLVNTHITRGDYQSAIDLIQARIGNPASEIDSLMAVMDLEIVLKLADLEADKSAVVTKYSQYSYPNLEEFHEKHDEHWALLYKILRGDESPTPPIPSIPLISNNYPNPFNPSSTIAFSIPKDANTKLCIYNTKGQKVKDIINGNLLKGFHKAVWDGKDNRNRSVGSGVYLIRLDSGGKTSVRKVTLMK